jgi:hypothetical protein
LGRIGAGKLRWSKVRGGRRSAVVEDPPPGAPVEEANVKTDEPLFPVVDPALCWSIGRCGAAVDVAFAANPRVRQALQTGRVVALIPSGLEPAP